MKPRSLPLCASILLAMLLGTSDAAETVEFAKHVAPVLATRCAGCHDALEKKGGLDLTQRATTLTGGESGPALVVGDVEKSLLWERIAADEMPPKHPLPAAERAILKTWIQQGALWQGGTLDPLAFTSDQRAGYDWWSLQPEFADRPTAFGTCSQSDRRLRRTTARCGETRPLATSRRPHAHPSLVLRSRRTTAVARGVSQLGNQTERRKQQAG